MLPRLFDQVMYVARGTETGRLPMVPESRLDAGRSTTPVSETINPGAGPEAAREQSAMLASRGGRLEGGRVRARHACR